MRVLSTLLLLQCSLSFALTTRVVNELVDVTSGDKQVVMDFFNPTNMTNVAHRNHTMLHQNTNGLLTMDIARFDLSGPVYPATEVTAVQNGSRTGRAFSANHTVAANGESLRITGCTVSYGMGGYDVTFDGHVSKSPTACSGGSPCTIYVSQNSASNCDSEDSNTTFDVTAEGSFTGAGPVNYGGNLPSYGCVNLDGSQQKWALTYSGSGGSATCSVTAYVPSWN